jgi:hypothetical protein
LPVLTKHQKRRLTDAAGNENGVLNIGIGKTVAERQPKFDFVVRFDFGKKTGHFADSKINGFDFVRFCPIDSEGTTEQRIRPVRQPEHDELTGANRRQFVCGIDRYLPSVFRQTVVADNVCLTVPNIAGRMTKRMGHSDIVHNAEVISAY